MKALTIINSVLIGLWILWLIFKFHLTRYKLTIEEEDYDDVGPMKALVLWHYDRPCWGPFSSRNNTGKGTYLLKWK
jgi:hypothetical protein